MSTPAQPDAHAPSTCVLCGAPLVDGVTRCHACGLYQQLGARRPNPFTRGSLWALAGLLLAVYVVALVIVSLAR
ncbi:MAG: hypothetical protein QOI55_3085 [Actinomycetota bacterium]|jgi:hypothetical protein|nr:hypothetical protein [Actinomycetota bacterium]